MQIVSEILIRVLWVLGSILVVLSLWIVANKALREVRERRAARIRRALEPRILEYVNGKGERLAALLPPARGMERQVVEDVLLDNARFLKGNARARITATGRSGVVVSDVNVTWGTCATGSGSSGTPGGGSGPRPRRSWPR